MTRDSVDPAARSAWEDTLADARELADGRESAGWTTLTVQAGETALDAEPADGPPTATLLIPDDDAGRVREWVASGSFPAYDVYRASTAGTVFLVVELLDADRERCLLVVATYPVAAARGVRDAARQRGRLRTRLRRLDGTTVASFEHDDVEKFFPSDVEDRAGRQG